MTSRWDSRYPDQYGRQNQYPRSSRYDTAYAGGRRSVRFLPRHKTSDPTRRYPSRSRRYDDEDPYRSDDRDPFGRRYDDRGPYNPRHIDREPTRRQDDRMRPRRLYTGTDYPSRSYGELGLRGRYDPRAYPQRYNSLERPRRYDSRDRSRDYGTAQRRLASRDPDRPYRDRSSSRRRHDRDTDGALRRRYDDDGEPWRYQDRDRAHRRYRSLRPARQPAPAWGSPKSRTYPYDDFPSYDQRHPYNRRPFTRSAKYLKSAAKDHAQPPSYQFYTPAPFVWPTYPGGYPPPVHPMACFQHTSYWVYPYPRPPGTSAFPGGPTTAKPAHPEWWYDPTRQTDQVKAQMQAHNATCWNPRQCEWKAWHWVEGET